MAHLHRAMACGAVLLVSLVLSAPLAGQGYPDISGEWMEGSDHRVHISQNGGAFTATCTYGDVSWRMEGTVSADGVVAGRLTHTAGVPQSATGFTQDRRMALSADRRTLQGQATFVGGGGGHALTWTRTSAPPAVGRAPDISGEWMEGSDHRVHISQNGGAFTATCTYGDVSWRMEGTVSADGVVAGRLTHTAGVPQSATGFAQDRRMALSADRRTLQGQATFVGGGGGHALTWTRTSAVPPVGRYPDISGEWMEGSDHRVHISQNDGAFTATCTYGDVSWRMEGTVSADGVVAGRLTHTAGVPQSATGFAQDRRMALSADRQTLQGQATFVGGGGGHAVTWTRSSALPPSPPQPPANAVRYRVEVLIYNSPDVYTNPRNWHDYLVDFSRCTVQSVSVPALSINVSVCRDRKRLTFTHASGGGVIEQDWVFRDSGRIVGGAWRLGGGFGPVAGSILAMDGSDNGWQTR